MEKKSVDRGLCLENVNNLNKICFNIGTHNYSYLKRKISYLISDHEKNSNKLLKGVRYFNSKFIRISSRSEKTNEDTKSFKSPFSNPV